MTRDPIADEAERLLGAEAIAARRAATAQIPWTPDPFLAPFDTHHPQLDFCGDDDRR